MENDTERTDGLLITKFTLGGSDFGINARLVLEVVKVGDITCVHGAPSGVIGIRNLRGRIVTVIDMAVLLALGTVVVGEETRMLIMENLGEAYGFLVDTVTDAIEVDDDNVESPPASLDVSFKKHLFGVLREGEQLTSILDPQQLFVWEDELTTNE